jgi:hypothetical protein
MVIMIIAYTTSLPDFLSKLAYLYPHLLVPEMNVGTSSGKLAASRKIPLDDHSAASLWIRGGSKLERGEG